MLPFENIDQKRRKSDFPKQVEPCCLNIHRAECPPYFPTVGGSQLKFILKGKIDLPTKNSNPLPLCSLLQEITSPCHLIDSGMTEILPADVFPAKNDKFQYYTRLYCAILSLSTYKPSMTTATTVVAISVFVNQCANLIGKTFLFCATA
jgi:hypothetical protein